jgi:hypothetical protein
MKRAYIRILILMILVPTNILFAEETEDLQAQAKKLIVLGQFNEAIKLHEQILGIDSCNYESIVWLGNYFFLKGQDIVNDEDKNYNSIQLPSRMQMAFHMEELKKIYNNYFLKAEPYLEKAYEISKNEYLNKLIVYIDQFRIKIGLKTVQVKKIKGQ